MLSFTYTALASPDDTKVWTFENPGDYTYDDNKVEPESDNLQLKLQDAISNFSVDSGHLQSDNVLDVAADDTYYFVSTDLGIDVITQDTWERSGYITAGGGFTSLDVSNGYLYGGKIGGIYRWQISSINDNYPVGNVRYSSSTTPALSNQNIQKINTNYIDSKVYIAVSTSTFAHIIKDDQGTPSIVKASIASGYSNNTAFISDDGALYYDMKRSNYDAYYSAIYVKYNAINETNDWVGWTDADVDFGRNYAAAHGPDISYPLFTDLKVASGTSTANPGDNTIYLSTEEGLTIIQENRIDPPSGTINNYLIETKGSNIGSGSSAKGRFRTETEANRAIDGSTGSYYDESSTNAPDWLEFDLGSEKTFNSIRQIFWTNSIYVPSDFKIEKSTQGTSENLSINATAWGQWAYSNSYLPSKANDGSFGSHYYPRLNSSQMSELLLEQTYDTEQTISAVDLQFYTQGTAAKDYVIEGSSSQTIPISASNATSSSVYSNPASYGPLKAIDGNSTAWRSGVSTNTAPQWLQIDLGTSQSVEGVTFSNYGGNRARDFSIDYSDDGVNWASAYSAIDNTNQSNRIKFSSPVNGRYIRLYVTESANPTSDTGLGIYEIQAFSSMFESGTVTELDTVTNNSEIARQSNFSPTLVKSVRIRATSTFIAGQPMRLREMKTFETSFDAGTVEEISSISDLSLPGTSTYRFMYDNSFESTTAQHVRITYTGYDPGDLRIAEVEFYESALPNYWPKESRSNSIDISGGNFYTAQNTTAPEDGKILKISGVNVNSPNITETIDVTTRPDLASDEFTSLEFVDSSKMITGTTEGASFIGQRYANNLPTIEPDAAYAPAAVASWNSFSETATKNGGEVYYQISNNDGANWYYWNGSAWVEAGTGEYNTATVVNENINDFDVGTREFKWRAYLESNGAQDVSLTDITLVINPDITPPAQNASNITMFTSDGGDSIGENDWTNDIDPFFSWDAAVDDSNPGATGIKGYCLYIGTDETADPEITKGVLGTSPLDTDGACPFAVSTNSIDLSTSGYFGSGLNSSNTSYNLRVQALDFSNNVFDGEPADYKFKFDNTPPNNPDFITAPSQFIASKEVTLTWPNTGEDAASDANSGLAGLQYRIGNSTWYGDSHSGSEDITDLLTNDGSYTTIDPIDFDNIVEGNNTVYFRSWDTAGNVSTVYTTTVIKLNTSAPSSPQNTTATPSINTSNSFAFSWVAPNTYQGSDSNITYCYTVNTLPTENTCIYTEAGVTTLPAGPFANQPGDNTFYVVAKDEAENINYATAASTTFTANTSAPGIPLELDVADVSTKATSTWRLALSWNEPSNVGAGVSTYRIFRSTDNVNFSQVATTSGTSYVDAGLTQQDYYYKIAACDSANNCGADSSVVNDFPTGRFTSPANITAQPSVSGISTKRAVVRWATDRNSDSKVSIGTSSGNYQPFQIASNEQTTDHRVELNNLTPGTTYFAQAVWTDEDGNTGTSSEFTFRTEDAPSTQEVETRRTTLSSAQIRFTSVSAAKVVIQYGLSDSFGGVKEIATSLEKSTYDVELTGLNDGAKYFYRLNTFDADGNEYVGSTVLTFTTPARPRIENLRFQPVEGEPTSTQQVTWTSNVPTSSLIRFSAENAPGKEVSDSALATDHEVIIKDLLDDTEYSFVAESRDKDGNLAVSDTQVLRTALDTRPPKISDITTETTIRGTGAEARGQIIVSWKTDEPATSQVAYAEGSSAVEFNNRSSEDGALATEHIVIVSDLPTSRVYSVKPISKDNAANEAEGESQSAIIGRASDDVITIVLNTLRRVFGF